MLEKSGQTQLTALNKSTNKKARLKNAQTRGQTSTAILLLTYPDIGNNESNLYMK